MVKCSDIKGIQNGNCGIQNGNCGNFLRDCTNLFLKIKFSGRCRYKKIKLDFSDSLRILLNRSCL